MCFALLWGATTDLYQRRIPNICTFGTMASAVLVHCLCAGVPGLLFSLKGAGIGFSLLILPYLLGGIGAGDVKLMAAVGAVLGVEHTLVTFLFVAIVGGVVALGVMITRGELRSTLRRIGVMFYGFCSGVGADAFKIDRATLKQDGIPYGAVIAAGTYLFFAYRWLSGQGLPIPVL